MPRNGSGTYSLPAGNPVVTGTSISSTVQNNTMSDVATAITQSIAVDGQSVVTANIPMNSKKITGLAAGTTSGDALSYGQAAMGPISGTTGAFSGDVTLGGTTTGKGIALVAYKPSTTSRSATTTLADDPDLTVALTPGTWQVELFIPVWATASGAGGAKYATAFSGTATGMTGGYAVFLGSGGALGGTGLAVTATAATVSTTSFPSVDYIRLSGVVIVTVAGNMKLQWAQNSSNANALNFGAGAYLTCTKLF